MVLATIIPTEGNNKYSYNVTDFDNIYHKILTLSEQNHTLAEDVASWCEIASVKQQYEVDEFKVVIEDR